VAEEATFEVRFANGETEKADSLWSARHAIARRAAFDTDPLHPRNVLPAEVWKTGANVFGRGIFVERIQTAAELSAVT
jgi:hypothetical protein